MFDNIKSKLIIVAIAIIAIFFLEGFIFYAKPKLEYKVSPQKAKKSKGLTIHVKKFEDVRKDKGSGAIGDTNNAFFKTGDVKEPDGIEEWVTNAMEIELKNAGYEISDDSFPIAIEGHVLNIYAEAGAHYEASVTIVVKLIKNGKVLLDKMFTGNHKKTEIMQFDISKGTSKALSESLKDAINKSLIDINAVLDDKGTH